MFSIPAGKYKRAVLQATVKYDDLKTARPGRGMHGLHLAVNFSKGRCIYGYDKLKKDVVGSSGWQMIQMDFKIPANCKYLNPHIGIGEKTTGKVSVSDVKIILLEK